MQIVLVIIATTDSLIFVFVGFPAQIYKNYKNKNKKQIISYEFMCCILYGKG